MSHQVAYHQWHSFCDAFSRRHGGACVRVELISKSSTEGDTHEVYATDTPLHRIRVSRHGLLEYVVISVGEGTVRSFVVRDPGAVHVEPQRDDRSRMRLRITARNGTEMILHFHDAVEAEREEQARTGSPWPVRHAAAPEPS